MYTRDKEMEHEAAYLLCNKCAERIITTSALFKETQFDQCGFINTIKNFTEEHNKALAWWEETK